jgi:hypothetical protein
MDTCVLGKGWEVFGQSVLLVTRKRIYDEKPNHSLSSEFQVREFGMIIDSISHKHGGIQKIILKDNNGSNALTISLDITGFMIHIRHIIPTTVEIKTLI